MSGVPGAFTCSREEVVDEALAATAAGQGARMVLPFQGALMFMSRTNWQKTGVAVVAIGILLMLARGVESAGPRPGPKAIIQPLDNGSAQLNLPGNIATLPLFLRNGGHFGFGSGAFGQLQTSPPAGGVIVPQSVNLGNGGGGGGALLLGGGGGSCQGTNMGGFALGGLGGLGGQQSAFFPCTLQQGQFPGALVQRVVQDGFNLQYGVAVVPQVLGGIPTLPVQMGAGFGSLKGVMFQGNQQNLNQANQQNLGALGVGGKLGIAGLSGACGCY